MSVEQFEVVDIISIDKQTGHVVLTISDHLDWSDTARHQTILQSKMNAYLAFVESGEILKSYPDAAGRSIAFKIVFMFRPDEAGREFLFKAEKVVVSAGFSLRHELFAESYDN